MGETQGPDCHCSLCCCALGRWFDSCIEAKTKIVFLIKQNVILCRVKVYLAVKSGTEASPVARDLSSFCLVALPASPLWSIVAEPPPALVAACQSAGWGERQQHASFLLRVQPNICTDHFHSYPIESLGLAYLQGRLGMHSFAMSDQEKGCGRTTYFCHNC